MIIRKIWPWLLAILVISIIWYFWNEAKKAKATTLAIQTNANTGIVNPMDIDYVADASGYTDSVI